MAGKEEVLDLVNDKDEVIGTITRSDYYNRESNPPGYIRAAEMFILNQQGQLWIPTRTAHKPIAPNGLDYSMGGHVSSGEDYMISALREIQEELNLDLQPMDLQFMHKFRPVTGLPYFRSLYIYRSNQEPAYNPDDFASAAWMHPGEVVTAIKFGTPAKTSLLASVEYLHKIF